MNHRDKFLFFDLGNVIAMFDHDLMVQNLLPMVEVAESEIRSSLFDSELLRDYELGNVSTTEFYEYFCKSTGCTASENEVAFACSDIFHINAPVIPLVSSLKQAGYRLGILSNTSEAHWCFLLQRYCLLQDYFDVHALSFRLNALKPDSEIYSKAAELAETEPENIFFVDDRAEHIEGARSAGWRAEVFRTTPELAQQLSSFGVECNF